MELNILLLKIYLFASFPFMVLSNNPVMKVLSNQLLDENAVLPLTQLIMTAKLLKDLQQKDGKLNGIDKTRYLFFVGKGNIQFQNHELEVVNSTESSDTEMTTNSYDDLSKNKHLYKFVARNGYHVWKKLSEPPKMSYNETHLLKNSSSGQSLKRMESEKSQRIKLKPLHKPYKPDVQLIESENGIIVHKVNTPQWFTKTFNNVTNSQKNSSKLIARNELNQKQTELFKMPDNEDQQSIKSKKKAIVSNKRKSTSRTPNSLFALNNQFGKIVMGSFNEFIRGISSMFRFGLNGYRRKY